ncbi:MAG: BolA family transcriptional regulator [Halioglobus sp.]|nr:BolA family transcriptional regulator [Halioglobus sp.]
MSVQTEIETALVSTFAPTHLEVANESHMHSVPENSETHFRVVLVSEQFAGKRQVARHQLVYSALGPQLEGPVHALALHTYSPAEWQERTGGAPDSPECRGGSKAEQGGAA